ncbi:MAG: hypothetical protein GXO56_04675 [Chloroflexi bacterium]|nr:hypothetical protein [Chloroflexota bacterium]
MSNVFDLFLRILVFTVLFSIIKRAGPRILRWPSTLLSQQQNLQQDEIRYNPLALGLTALAGIGYFVFALLALYSRKQGNPTASWGIIFGFAAAGVFSLGLAAFFAKERLQLSPTGITYTRLWESGFIPWSQIKEVKYSSFWQTLIIKSYDGDRITMSPLILHQGPKLAKMLLEHAPTTAISDQTREFLQQWARGYALPKS